MKYKYKYILSIIAILFITMLIISSSTFAFLQWRSSESQRTGLAINVTEKINMHIENPSISKIGMYPTKSCSNEEATMSGVSLITIENQTGVMARPKFKLKVKITDVNGNVITNEPSVSDPTKPNRYYINYAVTEANGDCTKPRITGRFDLNTETKTGTNWYDSNWITLTNPDTGFPMLPDGENSGVTFTAPEYETTTHEYKVWAWIDSSYTVTVVGNQTVTDPLQDTTIEVSWSENSTVQQFSQNSYAVFSSEEDGGDNSLRFYKPEGTIKVGDTYNDLPVTAVYTGFDTVEYEDETYVPWYAHMDSVETIVIEDEISPISTAWWFYDYYNCSYIDVTNLNTSSVTNMAGMFGGAGSGLQEFEIIGMNNWDTSNVTSMDSMFSYTGYETEWIDIGDISDWDTSNVIDMSHMFDCFGTFSSNGWTIDLSEWNVDNVLYIDYFTCDEGGTIISPYFSNVPAYAVFSSEEDGGDNSLRFYKSYNTIEEGTTHNGLPVTAVYTGFENEEWDRGGAPWNYTQDIVYDIELVIVEDAISPITTSFWFSGMTNCHTYDLANLKISRVTNMSSMFDGAGYNVTRECSLYGLEKWDTSNVINMNNMFKHTCSGHSEFYIDDISGWDTSKVTDMSYMFYYTGWSAWNTWSLDLSGWNVQQVKGFDNFKIGVEDKVISPDFNS